MRNTPCIPSDIQDTISDFLIVPARSDTIFDFGENNAYFLFERGENFGVGFLGGRGGRGKGGSLKKKYRISV